MSAKKKLTKEEIEHLLNLVREHWPEVYQYEEGITNKALNRIQEIAEKEGVASITPPEARWTTGAVRRALLSLLYG